MKDILNRVHKIRNLCEVVEGELAENGHPLFAGKAAALRDLAESLERALVHLGDDNVSTTEWLYGDREWHQIG